LWMNFTAQCGAGRLAGNIQAESSLLYWSKSDTDGNLLRHTSAAMSAIMGGADALLVHPHTFDPASAADAIRLSVGIGHLALEEARLKNSFDPGSGSYLIEMLTHELVRKAWSLFCSWQNLSLEEKLQSGFFPEMAGQGAARLKNLFAKGELTLTGVNRHPSPMAKSGPACPVWQPAGTEFPALNPILLDA
jgi:methylmalonyl-CoA mutase